MTVSAFREAINGFITEVYEKFTNVQAEPDEDAPDTLEEIYEVTWVPEGFELVEEETIDYYHRMLYVSGNDYISFTQYRLSDYAANYDTERKDLCGMKVGDKEGLGVFDDNTTVFVWNNQEYIFELTASLTVDWQHAQNELSAIVENVTIVEKP